MEHSLSTQAGQPTILHGRLGGWIIKNERGRGNREEDNNSRENKHRAERAWSTFRKDKTLDRRGMKRCG